MEINTAIVVYKSFGRSIMDYGLFVYYPRTHKGKEKIEKLQYKGIRIAMGYRNSTPTNVMLMEARIMRMEERAGYLARKYWTKINGCKNKEMENILNRLEILECRNNLNNPNGNRSVITESWRQVKKWKEDIDQTDGFTVHNKDYWVLTKQNLVNLEIGKNRKKEKISDQELLEEFRQEYKLREDFLVIYTDGSKQEGKKSTGVGIAIEGKEVAYKISINKICSIFTAEAIGVEKAIGYVQENNVKTDVVILTDSESVCKAISSNKIKMFIKIDTFMK